MIRGNKLNCKTLAAALCSCAAMSAHAQVPTAQPPIEPSMKSNFKAQSIAAVTDYRFRGISLSSRKPAI